MQAYNDSKLEIVLFSLELQRRLEAAGSPVRSILAHPGIATTTRAAHSPAGRINSLKFLINDPERGALPTLFAVSQDVPGNAYVGPDGVGSIKGYPRHRQAGQGGPGRNDRPATLGRNSPADRHWRLTVPRFKLPIILTCSPRGTRHQTRPAP